MGNLVARHARFARPKPHDWRYTGGAIDKENIFDDLPIEVGTINILCRGHLDVALLARTARGGVF